MQPRQLLGLLLLVATARYWGAVRCAPVPERWLHLEGEARGITPPAEPGVVVQQSSTPTTLTLVYQLPASMPGAIAEAQWELTASATGAAWTVTASVPLEQPETSAQLEPLSLLQLQQLNSSQVPANRSTDAVQAEGWQNITLRAQVPSTSQCSRSVLLLLSSSAALRDIGRWPLHLHAVHLRLGCPAACDRPVQGKASPWACGAHVAARGGGEAGAPAAPSRSALAQEPGGGSSTVLPEGGPAIPQPGHRSTTAPSHGGSSGAVSGGGDSGSSGKLSVSLIATLAAGGSALLMVMALVLSLKAGVLNVVRWPARCCHGGSTKHDGGAGEDASDTELGLIKGRGSGGGATPAGGPGPGGAPGTSLADNSWHSGKPRPDTIPECDESRLDMDSTSLTITVQPPPCGSPTPPSTTSLSPSPLKPPPLLTSNAVFEASRQGLWGAVASGVGRSSSGRSSRRKGRTIVSAYPSLPLIQGSGPLANTALSSQAAELASNSFSSQGGSSCTCGSSGCSLGASHSGEGVDKRLPAAYPLGASRYIPGLEPYPLPVPPVVPGMPVVPVVPLTATAVLPQQRPAANDFSRVTPIPGARPLAFTASNAAVMDWSGRVAQQQRDILDGGSNYIDEVDEWEEEWECDSNIQITRNARACPGAVGFKDDNTAADMARVTTWPGMVPGVEHPSRCSGPGSTPDGAQLERGSWTAQNDPKRSSRDSSPWLQFNQQQRRPHSPSTPQAHASPPRRLRIIRKVAQGGFGAVFEGSWEGLRVAIKVLTFNEMPIITPQSPRGPPPTPGAPNTTPRPGSRPSSASRKQAGEPGTLPPSAPSAQCGMDPKPKGQPGAPSVDTGAHLFADCTPGPKGARMGQTAAAGVPCPGLGGPPAAGGAAGNKMARMAVMELAVAGLAVHPNLVPTYKCQVRAVPLAPLSNTQGPQNQARAQAPTAWYDVAGQDHELPPALHRHIGAQRGSSKVVQPVVWEVRMVMAWCDQGNLRMLLNQSAFITTPHHSPHPTLPQSSPDLLALEREHFEKSAVSLQDQPDRETSPQKDRDLTPPPPMPQGCPRPPIPSQLAGGLAGLGPTTQLKKSVSVDSVLSCMDAPGYGSADDQSTATSIAHSCSLASTAPSSSVDLHALAWRGSNCSAPSCHGCGAVLLRHSASGPVQQGRLLAEQRLHTRDDNGLLWHAGRGGHVGRLCTGCQVGRRLQISSYADSLGTASRRTSQQDRGPQGSASSEGGLMGAVGAEPDMLAVLLTALDIARGVNALHMHNIVHTDLKPHNIFICSNAADPRGWYARVGDYGLAVRLPSGCSFVSGVYHGTPVYQAPEVRSHGKVFKSSDAYSFGILLWELVSSRCLADELQHRGFVSDADMGRFPHARLGCSSGASGSGAPRKPGFIGGLAQQDLECNRTNRFSLCIPESELEGHSSASASLLRRPSKANKLERSLRNKPWSCNFPATGVPQEYVTLVRSCMGGNPFTRPTFQDIVAQLSAMLQQCSRRSG